MNLEKVEYRPTTKATRVQCRSCGRLILLQDAYADLDGKPFKGYYCGECTEEVTNGS